MLLADLKKSNMMHRHSFDLPTKIGEDKQSTIYYAFQSTGEQKLLREYPRIFEEICNR